MINQHPLISVQIALLRQHELRQHEEAARLARRVQEPHRLRRHIGRLFVALGQALQGHPASAPVAESAEDFRRLAA